MLKRWKIIIIINGLGLLSTAVVKHHDRSNLGRKRFIWLIGYSLSSGEAEVGNQGRNVDAGIEAEAMEEWCVLACSVCIL